jgi:hypothetical protein
MKDRGTLNTQDALLEVYLASNEPKSLVDEFSQSTKILDAEYKPAVLKEVTQMCTNLHTEEQYQLLKLLQKYEHLFDGTLGEFNMAPWRPFMPLERFIWFEKYWKAPQCDTPTNFQVTNASKQESHNSQINVCDKQVCNERRNKKKLLFDGYQRYTGKNNVLLINSRSSLLIIAIFLTEIGLEARLICISTSMNSTANKTCIVKIIAFFVLSIPLREK